MKKIVFCICCIMISFGMFSCKQKVMTKTKKEQTERKKDNIKISKEKLQELINDAEERMSDNDVQPVKEITYNPFYYKKVGFDKKEEFVKSILSEKDKRKYTPNNVLILQINYKNEPEIDYIIYVRENGKWKYLQRYK